MLPPQSGTIGKIIGQEKNITTYNLAPKSAADFAFLLHGFHFLKDEGVMAIILPHEKSAGTSHGLRTC